MRNRQFSYDEGEDDYYDEEEEDRLIEEHRLQTLQARGEGGGGRGGAISLSSYFDDLPGSTPQKPQQPPRRQPYDGSEPPGHSDRLAPDKYGGGGGGGGGGGDDEELVAAIAAELENRLGVGRFSAEQVRQAVRTSGYEVDTAEAILLSASEAATTGAGVQSGTAGNSNSNKSGSGGGGGGGGGSNRVVAPPPGLPPAAAGYDSHPPSSLAFGLCVDGRPASTAAVATVGGSGLAPAPTTAGVEQFGFDTPSPDDLNLFKQAAARGGGGGAGGGSGGAGGRKTDAFSSPKAKVVHISGSTPKSAVGRKSVTGTPIAANTPTLTKNRASSPTTGGVYSPSPQQSAAAAAAAQAIDDMDDAQSGGKERLAMVVIGHVDAGKSTLMGQVMVSTFRVFQDVRLCVSS